MRRVLVCDDSPVARLLIRRILDDRDDLTVVGEAADGRQAVALVESLKPDVVTMDVHMPLMDGLAATREIMAENPCPIVIVSAQVEDDVELSMRGLAAGALTVLAKPSGPASPTFAAQAAALAETVKLMSEIRVVARRAQRPSLPATVAPSAGPAGRRGAGVIAIAASTGGPNALARVLEGLPHPLDVPVLVVQHMTDGFHLGLAAWLDSVSPHSVRLAVHGEPVRSGTVLVAPGGSHLGVTGDRRVDLLDAAPIGGHRPSATHLFKTISSAYAGRAVGVILTGMGDDGVDGLALLRAVGGLVIAQDEATSVVFGMPGVAVSRGLAHRVEALDDIAGAISRACTGRLPRSA